MRPTIVLLAGIQDIPTEMPTAALLKIKGYFNNGLMELQSIISSEQCFADCSTSHGCHSMERSCHMSKVCSNN